MGEVIRVLVPGQPPSVNHTHVNAFLDRADGTQARKRVKGARAAEYIKLVWGSVLEMKPRGWTAPPYEPKEGKGMIVINIWLFLRGEVDADNTLKCLMDGVKLGLGVDDKRFLPRFQHKSTGNRQARVELEIVP